MTLKHWNSDKPEPPSADRSPWSKDLFQLSSTPIPKAIIAELIILLIILTYGLVLLHQDKEAFRVWIGEDGLVEWFTFVVLLMMSVYSFANSFHFDQSNETKVARRVWLFFGFFPFRSDGRDFLGAENPWHREPGMVLEA